MICKRNWVIKNNSLQSLYSDVRKVALSIYGDVKIPPLCYTSNKMGARTAGRYVYNYRKLSGKIIIEEDAIVFSSLMEKIPRESQIETVIHEIAHCVANKYFGYQCAHDNNWESVGNKIGKAFNQKVYPHVTSSDLLNLMREKRSGRAETPYKYELVCTKCGAVIHRYKALSKTRWMHATDGGMCIYKQINF